MNIQEINAAIKTVDSNQISDGYHTFGELYAHRICLYIALCSTLSKEGEGYIWVSQTQSDGGSWDGWFLMGIGVTNGEQITYHLPMQYWDRCTEFAKVLDIAPAFDGHNSDDVLNRLINL